MAQPESPSSPTPAATATPLAVAEQGEENKCGKTNKRRSCVKKKKTKGGPDPAKATAYGESATTAALTKRLFSW
jgi:hypothetical protein